MKLETKQIKSKEDFYSLKDVWNALENGADMTAFQSYGWNALLIEQWLADGYNRKTANLVMHMVTDDNGKCLLIFPATVQKVSCKVKWWGRTKGIYFLGRMSYSDYINMIYSTFNEEAFEFLMEEIRKIYHMPIYLEYLREDTALCRYLLEHYSEKETETSFSVYVPLQEDEDKYNRALSKSTRQNIRTAKNRMAKDGLEYEVVLSGKLEDSQLIDELIDIHTKRVQSKNKKKDLSFLHWASRYALHEYERIKDKKYDIIKNSMSRMENSVVVITRLNHKVVGYLYGLKDANAVRIMQNCFDEAYKFYSPLFCASYDLIAGEHSDRKFGIRCVDFTRGTEEYKYKLGGQELLLHYFKI